MFVPAGLAIAVYGYRRFCKKQVSMPTSPVHAEVTAQEKEKANSTAV
ncbi:hypothetical protein [Pontibacter oryzae]|nr:hypothetical protein [Pontibacter oryzae]